MLTIITGTLLFGASAVLSVLGVVAFIGAVVGAIWGGWRLILWLQDAFAGFDRAEKTLTAAGAATVLLLLIEPDWWGYLVLVWFAGVPLVGLLGIILHAMVRRNRP